MGESVAGADVECSFLKCSKQNSALFPGFSVSAAAISECGACFDFTESAFTAFEAPLPQVFVRGGATHVQKPGNVVQGPFLMEEKQARRCAMPKTLAQPMENLVDEKHQRFFNSKTRWFVRKLSGNQSRPCEVG